MENTDDVLSSLNSFPRERHTKIVATLGPASSTKDMIEDLFHAGVDVFRLNFSHGTIKQKSDLFHIIRDIERHHNRPICIIADLQGPKLRVGEFENGSIDLQPDQVFKLDSDPTKGTEHRVYLPHPEIIEAAEVGNHLLLDDGNVRLLITAKGPEHLETRVINGHKLSDRKGVNVPDIVLPLPALTLKDKKDLEFALDAGADWIALSFVQKPQDVIEARELIGDKAGLMLKIEKPSAVEHLEELIELSDGIMLARGDLGVEMPPQRVPGIQKQTVKLTRKAGKPLIIATQMLESMVHNPSPTRAEASDVANAVFDGADAVMLSAETAAGDYPIEAVEMMNNIAKTVERDPYYVSGKKTFHPAPEANDAGACTSAAYDIAQTIGAKLIANFTASGRTTLRTARERPDAIILCMTASLKVARKMILCYGVYSVHTEDIDGFTEMVDKCRRIAIEHELVEPGEKIVITAGVPFRVTGSTNVVRIITA